VLPHIKLISLKSVTTAYVDLISQRFIHWRRPPADKSLWFV